MEKHLGVATNRNLTVIRALAEKWADLDMNVSAIAQVVHLGISHSRELAMPAGPHENHFHAPMRSTSRIPTWRPKAACPVAAASSPAPPPSPPPG